MTPAYTPLKPMSRHARRPGSCAVAMIVKAPRAGAVKTRLVPPLTFAEAAELSVCFVRDTAANIHAVAADNRNVQPIAVYTPADAATQFRTLLPAEFNLLPQRGQSLGERLVSATEDLFALGHESLCLLGSDSPTVPPLLLTQAVEALGRAGDRVVLGASDDGGYYLIGLKKAHRHLFQEIRWSTAEVLRQTCERATELNLEIELLPAWYDVDDAAALDRLCAEMFSPPNTQADHNTLIGYKAPHTHRYLAQLVEATEGEGFTTFNVKRR